MNWDWDKLSEKKNQRPGMGGGGPKGPNFDQFSGLGDQLKRFRGFKFPAGKVVIGLIVLMWLASGIYIVEPDEVGLVLRYGAYHRTTEPGPHYHFPLPIESAMTPKVTQIRRLEVGFRTVGRGQGNFRSVPEESLMLTGDENIVDAEFIVQYQIRDANLYLFNIADQEATVKNAAEAAMREVVGYNEIDNVLTKDKLMIQTDSRDLLQNILDSYNAGIRVVAVQLQDVHPPQEVVDAFKDVASAREDRQRYINEAEAYSNDLLPKARGEAARMLNAAEAYKQTEVRRARGDASRFLSVLEAYEKAPEITRERLYIETMEKVLSNPNLEKVLLSEKALQGAVPYLPLDSLGRGRVQTDKGAQQ